LFDGIAAVMLGFNSNLVRLKVTEQLIAERERLLFQFQSGAIESGWGFAGWQIQTRVSIPIWCD